MKISCENCGRLSTDPVNCSQCGSAIECVDDTRSATSSWGWGLFDVSADSVAAEDLRLFLRETWEGIEEFTVHALLPSQLSKFDQKETALVRIFGREDFLASVLEQAKLRFPHVGYAFDSIGSIDDKDVAAIVQGDL
jgi:hypothetical protein